MNWFEYLVGHCWMTGWQSIRGSYRIWKDLLTGNYKDYALMWYDDPFTECYEWFWGSLGEDDTLPKHFLEYLTQLAEDVETGKVETIPMDLEQLKRMSDLLDDVESCEDM
jgi:hypothetical protein